MSTEHDVSPPAPREEAAIDARQAVAAHLRAERARAKLKQSELAKRAGLSENTVSRLETGARDMSLPQLYALTDALGIGAGDFLDAADARWRKLPE